MKIHIFNWNIQRRSVFYIIWAVFLVSLTSLILISNSCISYVTFLQHESEVGDYVQLKPDLLTPEKFISNIDELSPKDRFDPRLPIGAYLAKLRRFIETKASKEEDINNFTFEFHWDDWVDLTSLNAFFRSYSGETLKKDGESQNHEKKDDKNNEEDIALGFAIAKSSRDAEKSKVKALRGQADLYSIHPIPKKIVFLTEEKLFEVKVSAKHRHSKQGLYSMYYNDDSEKATKAYNKHEEINSEIEIEKLLAEYKKKFPNYKSEVEKSKLEQQLGVHLDVDPKDFSFDAKEELETLKKSIEDESVTEEEIEYKSFLEYAIDNVGKASQHFTTPLIHGDAEYHANHIAYPFYKRVIPERERQYIINRLSRAWFQFCLAHDVVTFINWGNLIGWYYNGLTLPYDDDIDVNLPIRHLDWLGRHYNRTLLIEDPRIGTGRFYFEVDPWYIERGSGQNPIDARLIDIRTGIYIDITALAFSPNNEPNQKLYEDTDYKKENNPAVTCKNWNWIILDDILPLRRTLYEGYKALVPKNFKRILTLKYGSESINRFDTPYRNSAFDKDTCMWVNMKYCPKFPSNKDDKRFDSYGRLTLKGACGSSKYQEDYNNAKDAIILHSKEMDMILKNEDPLFVRTEKLKPLKPDSWTQWKKINDEYGNGNHYW